MTKKLTRVIRSATRKKGRVKDVGRKTKKPRAKAASPKTTFKAPHGPTDTRWNRLASGRD